MPCAAHLSLSFAPLSTMLLSDLPLECLQLILKELKDRGDLSSLSRMLQVNSFFCDAALPHLYHDAFLPQYSDNDRNAGQKFWLVFQAMLRQLPPEDVGPLLSAAFDVHPQPVETAASADTGTTMKDNGQSNDDQEFHMDLGQEGHTSSILSAAKRKIDYLSHFRVFCFEQINFNPTYRFVDGSIDHNIMSLNKSLEKFAFTSSTGELANERGEGAYDGMLFFPSIVGSAGFPASTLRYGAVAMAIRRQLTWLLCSRSFEQIRILTIPLSDVDQYVDVVERFPALSSVTFRMDEFLNSMYLDRDSLAPEILKGLEDGENRRERQFRSMMFFVRRHSELFPGVLKYTFCSDSRIWPTASTPCPKKIRDELEDLLPPLANLRVINNTNAFRISRRIKETDLGSVRQVSLRRTATRLDILMAADPKFWSRCRNLKSIKVHSPGPLCFRWAVDEKFARERATASMVEDVISGSERQPILPPVPVSKVTIVTSLEIKNELNDIAIGFGETLGHYWGSMVRRNRSGVETDLHIGAGWRLPKIETLNINIDDNVRLLMDRAMVSGLGDGLSLLHLVDRSDYHYMRVIESCQLPSDTMPSLRSLYLGGWPALTFHPGILHLTPKLEELRLYLYEMAPLEDLMILSQEYGVKGQRPDPAADTGYRLSGRALWTWDWYLPHLEKLSMTHEFAFMFQFRMLTGCPSLTNLTLDISGVNNSVERVLTLQDFDILHASTTSSSGPSSNPSRGQVIAAPSVTMLAMPGRWSLSDEIVQVLNETVFPNLSYLMLKEATGFSSQGWVSVLRHRPLLKLAICGRQAIEELSALGLFRRDDPSFQPQEDTQNMEDELYTPTFLFLSDRWHIRKADIAASQVDSFEQ